MSISKLKYGNFLVAPLAVPLGQAIIVLICFVMAAPQAHCGQDVLAEATKLKQDGKIEKSLKVLENALKSDKKDNADVHFLYATLLDTAGNLPEAKIHFQDALRLAPNSSNAEAARKEIADIDSQLAPKDKSKKMARPGTIGIKVQEGGTIVKVFPNTPAAKAKIQEGDKIISADDAQASQMSVDALVQKIRGPENSNVKLVIERSGKRTTYLIKRLSPEAANKEASRPFWFLFGSKDQG